MQTDIATFTALPVQEKNCCTALLYILQLLSASIFLSKKKRMFFPFNTYQVELKTSRICYRKVFDSIFFKQRLLQIAPINLDPEEAIIYRSDFSFIKRQSRLSCCKKVFRI